MSNEEEEGSPFYCRLLPAYHSCTKESGTGGGGGTVSLKEYYYQDGNGAVWVGGVGGTVTARGKQRIPFSDHSTALNAHLQRILIVWQIVRCSESTYKYAPNETTRQPTDRHSQIARKEANTCWMAKVSCNSNNDVQFLLLHIIQARVVAELKVWVIMVAMTDFKWLLSL